MDASEPETGTAAASLRTLGVDVCGDAAFRVGEPRDHQHSVRHSWIVVTDVLANLNHHPLHPDARRGQAAGLGVGAALSTPPIRAVVM